MDWTLDGWKRVIGITAFSIAFFLEEFIMRYWGVAYPQILDVTWMAPLIMTLKGLGAFFGITGMGHKAMKGNK